MKSTVKGNVIKFIQVLLPFCIILFLADYLIGSVYEYHYNHQKQGVLYRISYAIDSASADYLVVGSSRATHHYNADTIQKITGHSVYNAGSEGRGIIYSSAIISANVQRYKPKLVIIDIRPNEFELIEDEDLATLLPYHKNKYVLPYIDIYSNFQSVKLISKIYPYNSLLTTIIAGESNRVDRNTFDRGGYIPMHGVMKNVEFKDFAVKKYKVDEVKIKAFKELLLMLEKNKIKSMVIISPLYFRYTKGLELDICRETIAPLKYSKFINLANHKEFIRPSLFEDYMHLNDTGATLFSLEVAEIVKNNN